MAVPRIVDTNNDASGVAAQLAVDGVECVIRYLTTSTGSSKLVKPPEARALAAAGLKLGLVFEVWGGVNNFAHDDITAVSGKTHGEFSRAWAPTVGAPDGAIIYFAIDTDVTEQQYASLVAPYLVAAKAALAGKYRIGVYACGMVCQRALDAGLVDAAWLTQSMGWNGSRAFAATNRWALLQGPETTLHGLSVDGNTAGRADYGGFVPFGSGGLPTVTAPSIAPAGPTPWLTAIESDLGLEEISGPGDNPKIVAKAMFIAERFPNVSGLRSYCSLYKHDDTAWCGLEAAWAVTVAGYMPPFDPRDEKKCFLFAKSWATWGVKLSGPRVGCIVVFERSGGGHVGFVKAIRGDTIDVIGGNQSSQEGGAVTVSPRKISEAIAFRMPGQPASAAYTVRPELKIGDSGVYVTEAQTYLGIPTTGDFDQRMKDAVLAVQRENNLTMIDGEIGAETWPVLLARRPAAPAPAKPAGGFSQEVVDRVVALAKASDLARVVWSGNRGRAPIGYIAGMAATFGYCYAKLLAGESAAKAMAVAVPASSRDALALYGLTGAPGVETLRNLFALLIGLGMRESSGKYWEGLDTNAGFKSADETEAGLFQQSWNSHTASPEIPRLFAAYSARPTGFLSIFKEGVPAGSSENLGGGDGAKFQALCKSCPAFAVECAAVGLRVLRDHWGPIINKAAEVRPEALRLLQQVQAVVDAGAAAPVPAPTPPPAPVPPADPALERKLAAITAAIRPILQEEKPTMPEPQQPDWIKVIMGLAQDVKDLKAGKVAPAATPPEEELGWVDKIFGGKLMVGKKTAVGGLGLAATIASNILGFSDSSATIPQIAELGFGLLGGAGVVGKLERGVKVARVLVPLVRRGVELLQSIKGDQPSSASGLPTIWTPPQ